VFVALDLSCLKELRALAATVDGPAQLRQRGSCASGCSASQNSIFLLFALFCCGIWSALCMAPDACIQHVPKHIDHAPHIRACCHPVVMLLPGSPFAHILQVVRARLQQRQAHNRAVQYRDGLATFKLIMQREGTGGLYKGLVPNVLRVMPQSAITFLVYEKVMQLLEAEVFRNLEKSWAH